MSDQNMTDFSKKHAGDNTVDPAIEAEIKRLEKNGELPCAVAFDIARKNNVPPKEVGMALDLMNIRLTKCQLGLFGYSPRKKIVKPLESVDPSLAEMIRSEMTDNRVTCISVWDIASRLDTGKMTVSGACESMGIKIKPCQLGAF